MTQTNDICPAGARAAPPPRSPPHRPRAARACACPRMRSSPPNPRHHTATGRRQASRLAPRHHPAAVEHRDDTRRRWRWPVLSHSLPSVGSLERPSRRRRCAPQPSSRNARESRRAAHANGDIDFSVTERRAASENGEIDDGDRATRRPDCRPRLEETMALLSDASRWPDWYPGMTEIDIAAPFPDEGGKVTFKVKSAGVSMAITDRFSTTSRASSASPNGRACCQGALGGSSPRKAMEHA